MQSQQKKLTDEITKTKNKISEYERKQKALEHTKPKETAEWKSIQRQIKKADEAAESYAKQLQKIEKEHIDSFMDIDPKRAETLGIEAAQSTKEYQKLYDAMVKAQDKSESLTGNLKGTQQYQSTDGLQAQKLANLDRIGEAKDKLETLEAKLSEIQKKNSMEGSQKLFKSMKSHAASAFKTIASGTKSAMNGLKKMGTIGAAALRKITSHTKNTNKATTGLTGSVAKMQKRMLSLAKTVLVYQMMRTALRGLRDYMGSMLKTNKQFMNSLSAIKGNLQTAFYPIYQTIMPILNSFASVLVKVTGYLATFFNTLLGHNVKTSAGAIKDQADATKDLADATKKANKELYSFDEINKQSDNSDSSSSGSGGSGITTDVADTADVSKMVEMIKQAWRDSDFTELGEIVGGKIKDGLDSIKWDQVQQTAVKIAACIATFINGALSVSGLDTSIGKTIGEAINTGVLGLDTFLKTVNWAQVGTFIAGTLNSAIATTSWAGLGGTICDGINAFFGTSTNFATHFDFSNLGASVGDLINGAITKIDWGTALFGAKAWGVGIANTINTAVSTTSWDAVGSTIGNSLSTIIATAHSFIKTVDVKAMAAGIATAINNALKTTDFEALGDTIGTAIGNLAGSIATFLKTVDWSKVAKAVLDTLKGVFKGITEDSDNMKAIGAIVATLIGAAIAKQAVAKLFTAAAGKVISALGSGFTTDALAGVGTTITNSISSAVGTAASAAGKFAPVAAKIAGPLGLCVSAAIGGWEVGKWISETFLDAPTDIKWSDYIGKNFDKEEAKSALKLWWGDIKSSVGDFVNGVKLSIDETKESFISKWNTAKSKFGEIKADVGAKFDTAADKVNSWKATAVEKLKGAKAAVAGAVDNGFDWGTLKNNVVNKIGTVGSKIGGILNNEKNYWKGNKKSINSKIIRKIGTVKSKIGADPNSIKSMRQKIQDGLQGIQVSVTTTNTDGTTNQAITPNNSETAAGKQVRIIEDGKPRTVSIYLHGKWWQYRNKKGQWTNYKMAASGGVFSNNRWLPVTRYATGGLPKSAEMFMAREAGPELVGRIGSRTAVVNNDQIVASVSEGVYRAVVAALGSGGNQQAINLALRLIMDGKQTTQIVIDRINEMIDTTGQIPIRI